MRRINYIYEQEQWPNFRFETARFAGLLEKVNFLQGQLHGRMEGYSPELRKQAIINALSSETIASNAIEDNFFDYAEVESAIARSLKIRLPDMVASGGMARGAAEAVVAGVAHFDKKITADILCHWQAGLYPGVSSFITGAWRSTGLEIKDKSGTKTLFQAPPAETLPAEMKKWLHWLNQEQQESKLVKASVAQFWLLTLHPFADGNGPLSRIISLMLIGASENGFPRYYAPSAQILKEKESYFQILEHCQKGNMDITEWIQWYIGIIEKSILEMKNTQNAVMIRQKLEDKMSALGLSARQKGIIRKIANREKGPFTSSEWAEAAGYSPDTALREIRTLLNLRFLQKMPSGGRSTRYRLVV
ncbi:MAG: Fic family protein [Sphingomonadales bacterium]|jgi:Fic family protein